MTQPWMKTLMSALDTPAAEAALGAAAGAVLARAGTGAALGVLGDPRLKHDPGYYRGLKRSSWLVGALLGGINPVLRDSDMSSPRSFLRSMTVHHRLPKSASGEYDSSPFFGSIDKGASEDVLRSDLFLNPIERESVLGILGRAPETSPGTTSKFNLTRGALRAGAAFVPAYAFGRVAGAILGAPLKQAKALSGLGALAYAIRSSGVTEYL